MAKKVHVVVIGGGISGLSTAIAYAKNTDTTSHPILLLEKAPKVGGMVTSFTRDGYLFDTVHMISNVSKQMDYFGVDLPLKRFEGYCARMFIADSQSGKARRIDIPSGVESFKSMLVANFADQGAAAARLVDYSAKMFDEFRHLRMRRSITGDLTMLFRCRRMVSNANKTFSQYMDRFGITNPKLREIFDIFAAFSGLPAQRISALFVSGAMISTLNGGFRTQQGFIMVPLCAGGWAQLRETNRDAYEKRKQEVADFFINKVEKYLIPNLRAHIKVMDVASPATFIRYVGTPTGSIYDMSVYPDNFGRKRLNMITPIKGLILPKFGHSIYGALQAGLHAADYLLEGKVTGGRASLP